MEWHGVERGALAFLPSFFLLVKSVLAVLSFLLLDRRRRHCCVVVVGLEKPLSIWFCISNWLLAGRMVAGIELRALGEI